MKSLLTLLLFVTTIPAAFAAGIPATLVASAFPERMEASSCVVLIGEVRDNAGNPVPGVTVNFDNGIFGGVSAVTNSSGIAITTYGRSFSQGETVSFVPKADNQLVAPPVSVYICKGYWKKTQLGTGTGLVNIGSGYYNKIPARPNYPLRESGVSAIATIVPASVQSYSSVVGHSLSVPVVLTPSGSNSCSLYANAMMYPKYEGLSDIQLPDSQSIIGSVDYHYGNVCQWDRVGGQSAKDIPSLVKISQSYIVHNVLARVNTATDYEFTDSRSSAGSASAMVIPPLAIRMENAIDPKNTSVSQRYSGGESTSEQIGVGWNGQSSVLNYATSVITGGTPQHTAEARTKILLSNYVKGETAPKYNRQYYSPAYITASSQVSVVDNFTIIYPQCSELVGETIF